MSGENGSVHLTVDHIEEILASGEARPAEAGASYSHLDHALQTAALLRDQFGEPGGPRGRGRVTHAELVVAGLVHDIGHLLPGVDDVGHARAAADGVRRSLGERVAELVRLHVAAKRYLVAGGPAYGASLSSDSMASLAVQGGPMSSGERARFESLPCFADAVALRRADDRGKVDGLAVDGLATWMEMVRTVALSATS